MKFSLALLAASVLGADKEISEARLLASKKTDSKILAQNQELTFSYKIYNVGSQEAFDVSTKPDPKSQIKQKLKLVQGCHGRRKFQR